LSPEDWEVVKTAEKAYEIVSKKIKLDGNNWEYIG